MKLINLFFLSLLQSQATDPSSEDTMQSHVHAQMSDHPGAKSSHQNNMTVPFNSTTATINIVTNPPADDNAQSDSTITGANSQSNSTTADDSTQSSQAATSDQSKHKSYNMTSVTSTDSGTTYLIPSVSVFLASLIASAY